jgi:hypothetical protein
MIGSGFGIFALIPAMFNLAAASNGSSIAVQVCTGDGQVHTVQIPTGNGGKGGENGLCCAKGCHNGQSRKRLGSKIEPAQ